MTAEIVRPFETIESALEFMVLLESVIKDASEELETSLEKATTERYGNGIRLALYKTGQLLSHVQKSRRILNDLTLIRGVLVGGEQPVAVGAERA
jgi:hypothetical protein